MLSRLASESLDRAMQWNGHADTAKPSPAAPHVEREARAHLCITFSEYSLYFVHGMNRGRIHFFGKR